MYLLSDTVMRSENGEYCGLNLNELQDLFGVSGLLLQELKQSITGLQKGELITRDSANMALGIGKPWQKIKVTHLI